VVDRFLRQSANTEEAAKTSRGTNPVTQVSDSDLLVDLHGTSCALKAFASTSSVESLEVRRRACGGHGYRSFSGIGSWYADYLPNTTWEGDNYMLTRQVCRYLLKSARLVLTGFNTPDDEVIRLFKDWKRRQDTGAVADFGILGNDLGLIDAFGCRVAYLTFEALHHRDEDKQSWNSLLVGFWRLSTACAQFSTRYLQTTAQQMR